MRYLLEREPEARLADVCASFQQAVIDVLVEKATAAVEARGRRCLAISGGVSSNGALQALLRDRAAERGIELRLAPRELRTDNAAMIAYAAALHFAAGARSPLDTDVRPSFDVMHFERAPEPVGQT